MCMHPCPLVRKKWVFALFQEISFTSNLNCWSVRTLWERTSMKDTRSSLLPTAIVCPSGDQQMLMFSPFVPTTVTDFWVRASHRRTVLSKLAVANWSGLEGCQQSWSTLSPWPLKTWSFAMRSLSRTKMLTVLSKLPEANRRPSQLQSTECTLDEWAW
uniref:Uncharacterized protein n=1 Tax=Ixodes ricinus TaxID=34613 RepID=A0A6B0UX71_IXORI